jgi:PAS domain-containing protein
MAVDKDDDEQCREWVKQRLARFRGFGPAEERPLKGGRWVSVQNYKTRDSGIFVIQTDITERKRAEDVVRQSEERRRPSSTASRPWSMSRTRTGDT